MERHHLTYGGKGIVNIIGQFLTAYINPKTPVLTRNKIASRQETDTTNNKRLKV
jgi:hypothetical protein